MFLADLNIAIAASIVITAIIPVFDQSGLANALFFMEVGVFVLMINVFTVIASAINGKVPVDIDHRRFPIQIIALLFVTLPLPPNGATIIQLF